MTTCAEQDRSSSDGNLNDEGWSLAQEFFKQLWPEDIVYADFLLAKMLDKSEEEDDDALTLPGAPVEDYCSGLPGIDVCRMEVPEYD